MVGWPNIQLTTFTQKSADLAGGLVHEGSKLACMYIDRELHPPSKVAKQLRKFAPQSLPIITKNSAHPNCKPHIACHMSRPHRHLQMQRPWVGHPLPVNHTQLVSTTQRHSQPSATISQTSPPPTHTHTTSHPCQTWHKYIKNIPDQDQSPHGVARLGLARDTPNR
jgi:hypothetical protein